MDIENIAYHLEFYSGRGNPVEQYRMPGPFLCPRAGERVHLHGGSLTMDVTRVVHDLMEHGGARIHHTVKIFGDEVAAVE